MCVYIFAPSFNSRVGELPTMGVRETTMEVRAATPDDADAIREVARRSLIASYAMSPDTIDGAVRQWYDEDAFSEILDDGDRQFLVAERDGEVVGFADAVVNGDVGDLLWLHVHPDYRGEGTARRLLDETGEALRERGVDELRGMVLSANSEGNSFYRHHGFEKVDEREIEIGGRRHVENVYRRSESTEAAPDDRAAAPDRDLAAATGQELVEVTTEDDGTVYADPTDPDKGSIAPFYPVYTAPDRDRTWGYYCGNCESVATAMDSMGRIECSDCDNTRKPTRWDSSYM